MALTPEDVINKRFQPTKFREGYDQDEVDDFLDEIVVELRRLNQENAELREQLGSGSAAASSEAAPSAEQTAAAGASAAQEQPAQQAPLAQESSAADQPVAESSAAEQQPAVVEPVRESAPQAPAAEQTPSTTDYSAPAESAAGVLAMAQKLHDQYVSEGRAERERLINEGRAQADSLVAEAETTKAEVLSSLEEERRGLESSVSGLRSFESSYRDRLVEFIGGQLQEIKDAPSLSPEGTPGQSSTRL